MRLHESLPENGYQSLPFWSARRPLGLDLLISVSRKNREERALSMLEKVVARSGTTLEQSLFGTKGIDTIDPENIEATLPIDFASKTHKIGG